MASVEIQVIVPQYDTLSGTVLLLSAEKQFKYLGKLCNFTTIAVLSSALAECVVNDLPQSHGTLRSGAYHRFYAALYKVYQTEQLYTSYNEEKTESYQDVIQFRNEENYLTES